MSEGKKFWIRQVSPSIQSVVSTGRVDVAENVLLNCSLATIVSFCTGFPLSRDQVMCNFSLLARSTTRQVTLGDLWTYRSSHASVGDLASVCLLGLPLALGDVELAACGGQLALLLGGGSVREQVLVLLPVHQPSDVDVTRGVVGDEAQELDPGVGVAAGVAGGVEQLHGG
ncbi:hypothetical protein HPG69_006814 [Diceros bicornis minor]|uniref:Uncharacterized protein n=1 Tax=Diceros bicornis minor TaxID=77932 RepID=A0A7J7EKU7_DICBM|nr:hypothetical protein HPG69_006814 [Diceros bicornis minor]